jgi:anti-sigma regulatory factor (Ser/Thr protein kinase)
LADDSRSRELVIPRSTRHLQEVRDETKRYLAESSVPEKTAKTMVLAVDEAVANVILHSHGHEANGTIGVKIEADGSRARVTVTNKGPYFDPTVYPEPDIQAHIRSGTRPSLGIQLMKAVLDDMNYTHKNGTNVLVLTKNLC